MINEPTPLISIVIPTYNRRVLLARALDSVIAQTYEKWEAIVVDNGSTDGTEELISRYSEPRIIYLKTYNDGIIARARNLGIRASKGEWIAFLDSDDWWEREKLYTVLSFLNRKFDLVYHDLKIVSNEARYFRPNSINSRQLKPPVTIDLLTNGNPIATSSVVVRAQILRQLNGMSERRELVAAEDYNTWLRIATLTDRFFHLPRSLGYYFLHNESISKIDMSLPARNAAKEFLELLDLKQRRKFESNLSYTSGRFNYLLKNNKLARERLFYSLKFGGNVIRIKSLITLFIIFVTS
jgi:glycosyltransferase involved in cell wall biosynthesis